MNTFEEFKQKYKPYKDTLVIDGFNVVKLAGVSRDDVDWYYDLYNEKGEKYKSSAVVSIVILEGVIPKEKYDHMAWQWNEFFKQKLQELSVKSTTPQQ